jgi:serine/threonine-protein kinase
MDPTREALQQAVAGRFTIEREFGRGGMGIVYLARELSLDRPVAIKLLEPALARLAAFRERFLREAAPQPGFPTPTSSRSTASRATGPSSSS